MQRTVGPARGDVETPTASFEEECPQESPVTRPTESFIDSAPAIDLRQRMLLVSFPTVARATSWAIVAGGFVYARHVAWIEVGDGELRPPVDPRALARARLRTQAINGVAIALLTSRRVASYDACTIKDGDVVARAIATVGLANALRAGDPAGVAGHIGTINLLVHVSTPLTDEALLEASAIATESKTAAMLEAGIASRRTGRPATGTGTDCTVTACTPGSGLREPYAGKHTRVGALVGAVSYRVVCAGIARWLEERTR